MVVQANCGETTIYTDLWQRSIWLWTLDRPNCGETTNVGTTINDLAKVKLALKRCRPITYSLVLALVSTCVWHPWVLVFSHSRPLVFDRHLCSLVSGICPHLCSFTCVHLCSGLGVGISVLRRLYFCTSVHATSTWSGVGGAVSASANSMCSSPLFSFFIERLVFFYFFYSFLSFS